MECYTCAPRRAFAASWGKQGGDRVGVGARPGGGHGDAKPRDHAIAVGVQSLMRGGERVERDAPAT
jgi:hypothetical protein